jgi:methyl-accepting chemotaxis protein
MFSLRRLPLAQQTLVGVCLICAAIALLLAFLLSRHTHDIAIIESERALETQTELIDRTVEYAREAMQREALMSLEYFARELPRPSRVAGTIAVGGAMRPQLMFGYVPAIGNQRYLLDYQKEYPDANTAFLVADGGRLYRATTLLQDARGNYRDGEQVDDDYASEVLAGKTYSGTIVRSGKMYALAARPVKDESGRIIGAITTRIPVDSYVKSLQERLGSLVIGKTGYAYILSEVSGDVKAPYFVMHRDYQGKLIQDLDTRQRQVMESIFKKKNGFFTYDWLENGKMQPKLAAFIEIPAMHWIVATSAPEAEFTAPYDAIRYWVLAGLAGMVIVLAISLFFLIRWQLRPLNQARDMISRVAETFDLTLRLNNDSKDEIGQITQSFDSMMNKFQGAFRTIEQQVEKVRDAVESVDTAAGQVAQGSSSQSGSTSAMAASIEEMSVSINTVATSASDAQTMAQRAGSLSEDGSGIIEKTRDEMNAIAQIVTEASQMITALGEESHQITSVVNVIRKVADQTNLLALNAAIEAARAGEQGRGFAVVADEVGKLAERTAQSTSDIGNLIDRIQASAAEAVEEMGKVEKQVEFGQARATDAGERMRAIREEAGKVSAAVTEISAALNEQSQASQDVAQHVESIARMTDQNNAAAAEAESNAKRLHELADEVGHTLSQFKV